MDGKGIPRELDDLAFVSVSKATGASIKADVWNHAASTGGNPFLSPDNKDWDMPFFLRFEEVKEELPVPSENSTLNFFFGVSGLFLLGFSFVTSCFRTVYLWKAGGGAIALRRDEDGRITGIQYSHPQPNWFWFFRRPNPVVAEAAAAEEGPKRRRSLLTEDQVKELPEITFSPEQDDLDCTYTTCSICIEDFEAGERICVLPRCKHSYHPECFIPWVTERQGRCPLCKVRVLELDEKEVDDEELAEVDVEAGEEAPEEEPSAEEDVGEAQVAVADVEVTEEAPEEEPPSGEERV